MAVSTAGPRGTAGGGATGLLRRGGRGGALSRGGRGTCTRGAAWAGRLSNRIVRAIRLRSRSTSSTLTCTMSPDFTDVVRILDEPVREARDVHEAVLVDADVDKRAEGGHIGHHALEQHPRLEVRRGRRALP